MAERTKVKIKNKKTNRNQNMLCYEKCVWKLNKPFQSARSVFPSWRFCESVKQPVPHSFHKLTVAFSRFSSLALRLFLCRHTVLVESDPFCTTLDLQLSSNSRAHWPLLQSYMASTCVILADAHSYFLI